MDTGGLPLSRAMARDSGGAAMTGYFYKLPKGLAAVPQRQLPATAKIVLAVIMDRIGQNAECWPGIRTLANDAGVSTETVLDAISRLKAAGLLLVDRRGIGRANHYSTPESVQDFRALKKPERSGKPNSGAQETSTEAPKNLEPNEKDQWNQTNPAARAGKRGRFIWSETELRFIVPSEVLAAWKRDYPSLDVDQEIAKAGQWHAANRRWRSFQGALVRWLNRAADGAKSKPAPVSRFTPAETDGTDLNALAQRF